MKKAGWQVTLQWVKAQAATRGNELADAIAKNAATKGTIPESCTRIPKSAVLRQIEEESVDKENQLDVTFCILYFSSNSCSTCFGQPCAHHQELTMCG